MNDLKQLFGNPALQAALQLLSLVFLRVLPVVLFTPVVGGPMIPRRLRLGLVVVLSCALLPPLLQGFTKPVDTFVYIVLMAKEFVIGLTLGFILQMLFETLGAVGAVIDLGRGATLANVLDPLTQNQESILSVFFMQAAVVLFLSVGGLQLMIQALADGMIIIRPQDMIPPSLVGPDATQTPIDLVANLFVVAVKLGAPIIVVVLLLDVALAVINRIAPQIHVYFLGMTVKGTIGLLILLLGLGLTVDLMISQFADTLHLLRQWTSGTQG